MCTYTGQQRTSNFSHFHPSETHARGEISRLGAFSSTMSTRALDCGIVIGARIGKGMQGKVYLAQNPENECQPIVLKVMERRAVLWDARLCRRFVKESEAYDLLAGHPNIIQPRALCCDVRWPAKSDPITKKDKIVLVLDVAPGGDLLSHLMCGQLPEPAVRWYARQLFEALAHAHAQGVAHRDIKPGEWPAAVNQQAADLGSKRACGTAAAAGLVQRSATSVEVPTFPHVPTDYTLASSPLLAFARCREFVAGPTVSAAARRLGPLRTRRREPQDVDQQRGYNVLPRARGDDSVRGAALLCRCR